MLNTKNNQGNWWGTAPNDWALYLETTFIPLYKKIISKSDLSPGVNVLDIGCGSGLFISMAGAKGAATYGIDLSPELLAIARQRNPLAALFDQDMERLPFEEKKFDLVTGFNSLQYADDIARVLTEIKRVMKEEGRLVIGIWGSAAECESLKVLASIASLLPEPAGGSPGPLALSAEKKVENLLSGAGMRIIEKGVAECHWNFSSLDEAIKGILSSGPSAEAIQYAGLEPVKKKLVDTLESFKIYDEIYVLENVFRYFIAAKA